MAGGCVAVSAARWFDAAPGLSGVYFCLGEGAVSHKVEGESYSRILLWTSLIGLGVGFFNCTDITH